MCYIKGTIKQRKIGWARGNICELNIGLYADTNYGIKVYDGPSVDGATHLIPDVGLQRCSASSSLFNARG